MSEQPEALRLAAIEEQHGELLKALMSIVDSAAANQAAILYPLIDDARAAIAKAEGATA